MRSRPNPNSHLRSVLSDELARYQLHLGKLTLGGLIVGALLAADGLALGPGRLDVALLSVLLGVMLTARLAGFWASLAAAFFGAVLIDLQLLYAPGVTSDRPLDLAALGIFGFVALVAARTFARSGGGAAPGDTASGPERAPAADGRNSSINASRPAIDGLLEPLTAREEEVLALLAAGLTNDEIATRLFLSPNTVKTHLTHVYAKLGVGTRTGAIARLHAPDRPPDATPPVA